MSSNKASSNGGVRNLRAMFENQHAPASPEPRGRSSPATSSLASDTDLDGRPRSKIRASFVPVEPSGGFAAKDPAKDLGATKGTAYGVNSPAAHRRESFSLSQDEDAEAVHELKKTVSQEKEDRKKSLEIEETIPEQAVESRDSSRPATQIREETATGNMVNLGSIMKGSDFPEPEDTQQKDKAVEPVAAAKPAEKVVEPTAPVKDAPSVIPEKTTLAVEENKAPQKATTEPKAQVAVSSSEMPPPPAPTEALPKSAVAAPEESNETTKPKAPAASSAGAVHPKAKVNGTSSHTAAPGKVPAKASASKPLAISTKDTTKATTSKSSAMPKSPAQPKTPMTPTTPRIASTAAPPAAALAASKAKAPAAQPKRTSTAAAPPPAASKPKAPAKDTKDTKDTAVHTSPFRKPRPKSPTRPVRLPSHLTAPTASYAAKHEDGSAPQTLTRRPSTIARDRPTLPKPATTMRKQPSRVSLPPQIAKRPDSRQSIKGPDEGFLARMMRPTASSASKTHEKANSPPRRTASVKPKTGLEGWAGNKRKLAEGASKAKDKVTANDSNGHHEDEAGPAEPATGDNEDTVAGHEENARESTPLGQAEASPAGDVLQTPNFEGQTIR